ncbi:nucleotidyltransferase family protein [gut metagenome]|uniref:Nucleotidyltransferase family protein n=1 Tax=gut metagenome TaxID=749906 RepID=J9GS41_9ZZZZ
MLEINTSQPYYFQMKALLFAAGLGTRLKPLTDHMPKALVPVGGHPLLQLAIDRLARCGAERVVVNVHHFAAQIMDYVASHHWDCEVVLSDESQALLDTGGGLKKALPLLTGDDRPVLLHNVDILSNVDLLDFYQRNQNNAVTLLVSQRKTQRYLLFNDERELVGWTNLQTGEVRSPYSNLDVTACHRYAFSGIHLVSPTVYPLLSTYPDKFPIMDFYLQNCDKIKIIADVDPHLQLLDVGKQDTLAAAESFAQAHGLI